MAVNATINGSKTFIEAGLNRRLIDFLREEMGLTSVKEGCGEGECGACTVLLNGEAVASCTVLVGQLDDCRVETVEGLMQSGTFSRIEAAFRSAGAVQCGYCTPGMVISTQALLNVNPHPTGEEIAKALEGNLCRCTGYNKIQEAVQQLAKEDVNAG